MASALVLKEDPDYTHRFPDKQSVRAVLELKNGETKTFEREEPVYLSPQDIISKLYDHCGRDLSQEKIASIVDQAQNLEQLSSPGDLLKNFL